MKRVHLLAIAGLAALISGCDQVRLPGASEPAPPEAEVEETGIETNDEAADASETETDTEGETPTVDRDSEVPPAETADTAPPVDPSLALYNATRCALPAAAPPTPTVASVAGATELEEPMIGVEAVNALSANLAAFPGIVKLEPRRAISGGAIASGHCGSVRIRANWLVTAAHCVDQPYDEIRLISDATNLRSPSARTTNADAAFCHGGYLGTENGYANDIALLRLSPEEAAALGNVPIARVASTGRALVPANYPTAEMAGWGLTQFGGQLSSELLTTSISITGVGPAAIAVASKGGSGPCIGDSGGPLYVTEADGSKTVIGVLSVVEQNRTTGEFCAGDYNGRYTNLQGYTAWIDSVIAFCEAQPDACR
jgi:hypothetical protein